MIEFIVARTGSARQISPVELTPGFPRLASASRRKIVVLVQPADALPGGKDVEREILRNHGVHTQERGLAIIEFEGDDNTDPAAHRHEALNLWCQFAHLLGWRIWDARFGDGLPPFEIVPGVSPSGRFGHGERPLLLVAPPIEDAAL